MALWDVQSQQASLDTFKAVKPLDVLINYGEPLTFTFLNELGNLMLAHLCDSDEKVNRFFVAPTNEKIVEKLKVGGISIRGALDQPWSWLLDVATNGEVVECWSQRLEEIPEDAVPAENVLLYRDLEQQAKANRFLESQSDGQIAFDGAPVVGHEIQVGFLAHFLDHLQGLYDAASTVLHSTIHGNLLTGPGLPSSYALDLKVPPPSDPGLIEIFGTEEERNAKPREVFALVESLIVGNSADTAEVVSRNQGLRREYGSVLKLMSETGARVTFRTRRNPKGRILTNYEAGAKFKLVSELGFPYGDIKVTGTLIGAQIQAVKGEKIRFQIFVNDNESFGGTIAPDALNDTAEYFGEMVIATLRVSDNQKGSQTYELTKVEPIPSRG